MSEKNAYTNGQEAAYSRFGVPDQQDDQGDQPQPKKLLAQHLPEKKSPSWLPALGVGALGAAAAYHGMRTPKLSTNPNMRTVQQIGAEKGFHRMVDVNPRPKFEPNPNDSWMGNTLNRLYDSSYPQIAKPGKDLDFMNKMKMYLHEGPGAIPVAHDKKGLPYSPGNPDGVRIDGVVRNRRELGYRGVRGGYDAEGPMATQMAMSDMKPRGKNFESDMLSAHAPDMTPKTFTKIHDVYKPGDMSSPESRIAEANKLQQAVTQHMSGHGVDRFVMKPSIGLSSGGQFPASGEEWGQHIKKFDKHFADPKRAAKFQELMSQGENTGTDYLKEKGLYEGYVMDKALKDPSSVQAQQYIPNAMNEYRVHVVNGAVVPGMTSPRFARNAKERNKPVLQSPLMDKMHQKIEETVARLPPEYRQGSFGIDTMHHIDPHTGDDAFKIVEMNPHTLPGMHGSDGATSGLLDSSIIPGVGHQDYRGMTGKHTPLMAGLAASAIGGGAMLGTRAYQDLTQDDDQDPQNQPHPVG